MKIHYNIVFKHDSHDYSTKTFSSVLPNYIGDASREKSKKDFEQEIWILIENILLSIRKLFETQSETIQVHMSEIKG